MKRIPLFLIALLACSVLIAGCANTPTQPTPSLVASPTPAAETTPPATPEATPGATPAGETEEGAVILYFANADASAVAPEARILEIPVDITPSDYARLLAEELIKGPQTNDLNPTIPPTVKVLNAAVEGSTVSLDFSGEMLSDHSRGAAGEAMTVYSIVTTLTEMEGIEGVLMTVAGEPMNIEHMVIDSPVPRDESKIQQ